MDERGGEEKSNGGRENLDTLENSRFSTPSTALKQPRTDTPILLQYLRADHSTGTSISATSFIPRSRQRKISEASGRKVRM